MFDPVARERIAHHLPDIKLIVSLRDPTKRAYSQFFHAKRNDKEDLESFEEALDLEPARLSSGNRNHFVHHSYVKRGEYIDQLAALEDLFGRDQVHVVLFDDLITEREKSLRRTFAFLGLRTAPAARIEEVWVATAQPADPQRRTPGAPGTTAATSPTCTTPR